MHCWYLLLILTNCTRYSFHVSDSHFGHTKWCLGFETCCAYFYACKFSQWIITITCSPAVRLLLFVFLGYTPYWVLSFQHSIHNKTHSFFFFSQLGVWCLRVHKIIIGKKFSWSSTSIRFMRSLVVVIVAPIFCLVSTTLEAITACMLVVLQF